MKFSEEVMRVLINHNDCEPDDECDCEYVDGGFDNSLWMRIWVALRDGLSLTEEEFDETFVAALEDRNT